MTEFSVEPRAQRGSPYRQATAHVRAARLNAKRADELFDRLWLDDEYNERDDNRYGDDRYDDGDNWYDDGGDDGGPDEGQDRRPLSRRAVLGGLAGTGVGGAALYVSAKGLPGTGGNLGVLAPPPPPAGADRGAAFRAADAGGFANRDESYARSAAAQTQAAPADEGAAGAETQRAQGAQSAPNAEAPPEAAPSTLHPSPSEAARAANPPATTVLVTDDTIAHLLRRATFGPTPQLVEAVRTRGIDGWIADQLNPTAIDDAEADGLWGLFPRANMGPAQIQGSIERYSWDAMFDYAKATLARQVWSERQLLEVMVDFWANHLNVPTPGDGAWDVAASYHNDVIRRHALGSFTDMLLAAARHPAMLRYLTNDVSSKDSVNENLGRELLELHTVGVQSGYTEDDVRNSAYILTGRTVAGERDDSGRPESTFVYDAGSHWTGAVRVLDFRHANATPEGGLDVGDAYLRYLAAHPATAQAIGRKLAVRFVSDDPPPALVDRLAAAFTDSGTQIVPVLQTLFRSTEFWDAVGQKTRRPLENIVASARVLGVRPGADTAHVVESLYWALQSAGHRPLAWPAPNGYPDVQAAWRSANGLLEVWNTHRSLVQGWQDGATYTEATALAGQAGGAPAGTVGEYVDALCRRLCVQTFQPEHRNALIAFLEAQESTPLDQADIEHQADHLVPLVLDSPYFALR
jgi:uncharacterized protein (DUF1800 family)